LLTLSFLYGLFHAAGPGHGKLLISGYGLGRPVAALRLAGLALASSLAQSLTAVVMVVAGIGLLNWTRTQVTETADGVLSLASYLAVAAVGLWLAVRGMRGIRGLWPRGGPSENLGASGGHHHQDDPDPHSHDDHTKCAHAHGPTPAEAENIHSLRDALVLIGAVAIRPCTGALFLLIVTWRMEILPAGIAGAFAMGLGTASVTVLAALASVWLRRSSLDRLRASLPDPLVAARLAAVTELAVGALVCFVALSLALRLI
jgi:ABC-type nickel/cobalt efflux system permease component RcnA